MRKVVAGGALILAVANPSEAQSLPDTVTHGLSPNDAIIVTTKNAGESRGAFVSASSASLVMSVKGRPQEIPVADIAAIDKPGDPVWGGAIIGGAILGLGFMGGAGASCSPNCDKEVPAAAAAGVAIGGAVGAGIDYLHRGRTRIYRAPREKRASPPAADRPATASSSLATLWERVNPGDGVSIALADGGELDGRFSRASDAELAVEIHGTLREFSAADVRRVVHKKGGSHGTRGLLIGLPLGALFGSGPCYRVESFMEPADSGMSCGAAVLIGTAAGGAAGFALGRTVWRRTIVYEAPHANALSGAEPLRATETRRIGMIVAPILSAHRIGVAGSITFTAS